MNQWINKGLNAGKERFCWKI